MSKDTQEREHKLQLCGWIFFITSALFFIVASLRAGDLIGLLGSIFFLLACLPFTAALLLAMRRNNGA